MRKTVTYKFEKNEVIVSDDVIQLSVRTPSIKAIWSPRYNENEVIFKDKRGRNKRRCVAEIHYVYFMYDHRSDLSMMSEKERHLEALKYSGLPEDYEISDELKEVIKDYIKTNTTPAIRALRAMQQSIETSIQATELLNAKLQSLNNIIQSGDDKDVLSDLEHLSNTMSVIEKGVKLSKTLPEQAEALRKMEQKILEDSEKNASVRGGQELSPWDVSDTF